MTTSADTAMRTFEAAWNEWHREREDYYADPLGWVSLNGLYWLSEEFGTVADLPGRWRADATAVMSKGSRVPDDWSRSRARRACSSRQGIAVSR